MSWQSPAWAGMCSIAGVVLAAFLFFSGTTPTAIAGGSDKWEQTSFDDFEKGSAEGISIRSDGRLSLAPRVEEVFDAPAAYLWALARDSDGNIFAAGGPDARVFRIGADGRKSTFFETQGVAIHALAVDPEGNVFAGSSPEAKVYKIDASGGYTILFEPEASYIWDLKLGPSGDLFVASGEPGLIYRVTPQGDSSVWFDSGEAHVRSLEIDAKGRLIAGTAPSGLILRISATEGGEAEGFVLYQSAKKEITSIAVARDGHIYAAAAGRRESNSGATPNVSRRSPSPAPPPAQTSNPPGMTPVATVTVGGGSGAPPTPPNPSVRIEGGSEVYRLTPDGAPRQVWESSSEIAYAVGLDAENRLLIATGDNGRLYRLEGDQLHSLVWTSNSTQLTALRTDANGSVLVAASNIGRVLRLGPGLAETGTWESEVLDAENFTRWGRVAWRGEVPAGAAVRVFTRSGNLDSPSRNWSSWSAPVTAPEGQAVETPPARFLQAKVELTAADGRSPVVDSLEVYYLSRNLPPQITHLEPTPPNYRFAPTPPQQQGNRNRALPPLGQTSPRRARSRNSSAVAVMSEPGYLGMRWAVDDPNGDELIYKLEIRGEGESTWKLLAENIEDERHDWDSTSFPDGRYRVQLTAGDRPSNPASEAQTAVRISEPFVIDNTPPRIENLDVRREGDALRVRFQAADTVSVIQRAEYSIDGKQWQALLPENGIFDSRELAFSFTVPEAGDGEHAVSVRVFDEFDNIGSAKTLIR